MRKIFTTLLFVLPVISNAQVTPGGIGTTNLTAWFKADDIASGSPINTWSSAYPAGTINLTSINASGPYPTATNATGNNAFNYNNTIDFTGSTDAANKALIYSPTGTLNLLDNSTSTSQGTMFIVYQLPDPAVTISTTGQHILQYRENSSTGDGIQLRRLSGISRMAIGNSNNVNATRDYTETFKPTILSYKGNYLSTMGAYLNNATIPNSATASASSGYKGLYIGTRRNQSSGAYEGSFPGYVSEVIFYNTNLSATDFSKVHTYLAIKYGITLNNTSNPLGGNGNYVAPEGTVIWNAATSSAYHNSVLGIGVNSNEGLYQKQSHTSDDALRIYMGSLSMSNADNFSTITNDNSYVMIGHNNDPLCNASNSTEYPSGNNIYSRIDREWKITNTGFVDIFNLDIALNSCINFAAFNLNDLRLLVDYDDGDFSNATLIGNASGVYFLQNGNVISVMNISNAIIPQSSSAYVTIASVNSATPLPLNAISLTAKKMSAHTNLLEWHVPDDGTYISYEVERSGDLRLWESLVEMDRLNDSQKGWYNDNDASEWQQHYRIKATDRTGKKFFSNTVSLGSIATGQAVLYPNPVKDYFEVRNTDIKEWKLIDINGRQVNNRVQVTVLNGIMRFNMEQLPAGIYFFRSDNLAQPVVKQ